MEVTRFYAHMVGPQFTCHDQRTFATESEALVYAHEQVGPNQDQVTVVAHTPEHGQTFGVRHFLWEHGEIRDTGWSRWQRGVFIGGGEMGDVRFEAIVGKAG